MSSKKDFLIGKFVKKDYNDELETILENKQFSEDEKNILLNILYKIENSYKDYESVKINVETVEEFIKNLIRIIKKDCEKIVFIEPSNEKKDLLKHNRYIVNKQEKEIRCYPIEREILYCVAKIGNKPQIVKDKYFLLNKTLTDVINNGKCADIAETIRDFNGFSWTTIKSEIEYIECNNIYQILRILVGYKFLNKWVNNKYYILDYFELLKANLTENYGEQNANRLIQIISDLSILIEKKYNTEYNNVLKCYKEEIEQQIIETQNMEEFIESKTAMKKELADKIGEIDEILNNKKRMKEEFIKRNNEASDNEKIFNIQILRNRMTKERGECLEELEKINNLLNPKKFIQYKKELIKNKKTLEFALYENSNEKLGSMLIELQKNFLECFKIRIKEIENKNDIINLFYEFRYYGKIPFDKNRNINQIQKLKNNIEEIYELLIEKAIDLKAINTFTNSSKVRTKIIKNIFMTRVINLTDLYIEVIKEEEKVYINLYDEDMLDNKYEIDMQDVTNTKQLGIKFNKKIKVFI